MNNKKDLIKAIISRKFAIAMVGIIALVYIATVAPGQLAVDQAGVTIVPMTPAGPPAEQEVDWKIPAEITLITCLTIVVQGMLDYLKPRNGKKKIDSAMLEPAEPENNQ